MEFRVLSKAEAVEWQARNPASDRLSDLKIRCLAGRGDDDIVAIIALDKNEIVARNFVFPAKISVHGALIDCYASGDLYVREDFRPQGLGPRLKMRLLQVGLPQIVGGAGGKMRTIYDTWRAYELIDDSSVYQLPLSGSAMLAFSRMHIYQKMRESTGKRHKLIVSQLRDLSYLKAKLSYSRAAGLRPLNCRDAIDAVPEILRSVTFPVQLPWNIAQIRSALSLGDPRCVAWIFNPGNRNYFISAYIRDREIRVIGKKRPVIREAHVNEMFPPPENKKVAQQLILCAGRSGAELGMGAMHIYAINSPLELACRRLGLNSLFSKSVYFAANRMEPSMADVVGDRGNWWCRGMNEIQFRETVNPWVPR